MPGLASPALLAVAAVAPAPVAEEEEEEVRMAVVTRCPAPEGAKDEVRTDGLLEGSEVVGEARGLLLPLPGGADGGAIRLRGVEELGDAAAVVPLTLGDPLLSAPNGFGLAVAAVRAKGRAVALEVAAVVTRGTAFDGAGDDGAPSPPPADDILQGTQHQK